jgi:hypothetical protein
MNLLLVSVSSFYLTRWKQLKSCEKKIENAVSTKSVDKHVVLFFLICWISTDYFLVFGVGGRFFSLNLDRSSGKIIRKTFKISKNTTQKLKKKNISFILKNSNMSLEIAGAAYKI